MLITLLQRYYLWIFIILSGLCGLAMGNLGATAVSLLAGPVGDSGLAFNKPVHQVTTRLSLDNFQPILQRNIFNSAATSQSFDRPRATKTTTTNHARTATQWTLVGTVSGGAIPLATLKSGKDTTTFKLNEELPDGAKLTAVERNRVTLTYPDGRTATVEITHDKLPLANTNRPRTTSSPQNTGRSENIPKVESLGENRWLIPSLAAENARSNVGDLLKQAQAVPFLEGNKTTGFQIRMIQPGSLIAQLGLQRGDILREVNGIALDSPEKALQIFGQLRLAKQISIGLERKGKAMTFSYEIR